MSQLQDLIGRVERLLLRYEELQRANQLLQKELEHTGQERDLLQSRLSIARNRIDSLLSQVSEKTHQD
ncbi:MAG: DUF904 domain-containing protein [Saezia sp.]